MKSKFKHDYVLVLGNGFDLDMKFRTSYSDFLKSEEWGNLVDEFIPKSRTNSLLTYLLEQKNINLWFNLEDALKDFAMCKEKATSPETDKKEFEALCNALKTYIAEKVTDSADVDAVKSSTAIGFLSTILRHMGKCPIYTFNYTPLERIIKHFCSNTEHGDITYVHGNANSNIVLGFELDSGETICQGYEYMKKSVQAKGFGFDVNIAKNLLSAKEVIFYGHSISKNDARYFREYFEALSNDTEGRHATVFTMDTSAITKLKANMEKNWQTSSCPEEKLILQEHH